jgi:hypothetical protein
VIDVTLQYDLAHAWAQKATQGRISYDDDIPDDQTTAMGTAATAQAVLALTNAVYDAGGTLERIADALERMSPPVDPAASQEAEKDRLRDLGYKPVADE